MYIWGKIKVPNFQSFFVLISLLNISLQDTGIEMRNIHITAE